MTRAGGVLFVDDEADWIDLLRLAFDRAGIPDAVTGVKDESLTRTSCTHRTAGPLIRDIVAASVSRRLQLPQRTPIQAGIGRDAFVPAADFPLSGRI